MTGEVVLGLSGRPLAELIAVEVPLLTDAAPQRIRILLPVADLEDGHDESYVHARIVELLDGVRRHAPEAEITLVGLPPVSPALAEERARCEASARVTAALRGIRFEPSSA